MSSSSARGAVGLAGLVLAAGLAAAACGPGAPDDPARGLDPANPAPGLDPAYRAQGMNQDGAGYVGRVELSPVDSRYRVTAIRAGDTLRGYFEPAAIAPGDSFDLRITEPVPATGRYTRHPDGRLEGRWQAIDGSSGWEVLRPFDTSLPVPDVHESYDAAEGTIRIGPGPDELFPRTDRGYTLIRPADQPPRAVAVFFDGFRVRDVGGPPVQASFDAEALAAGVALLRITTGDPLDFLFTDAAVDDVLDRVARALSDHGLEAAPLLFTGLSLGGTRAARAAIRLRAADRPTALNLAALAVVDAPLDMARLYRGEVKAIRDDAHPAAAGEGRWVTFRLRAALGGTPDQAPDAYTDYSPVTAAVPDGGNVVALAGLPVRAYHEPDIDWWIEHRGKTYGQINSPDLALLVERLRALDSPAELITSYRQRDGWAFGSSPHTWSFVDNAELVAWFLDHLISRSDGVPTPGSAEPVASDGLVDLATGAFRGARLVFYYPPDDRGLHGFRLRQPCEVHPNGRSYVYATGGGRVVRAVDACDQPAGQRALHAVYPVHAGKLDSGTYRALVFVAGLVLALASATGAASYAAKLAGAR